MISDRQLWAVIKSMSLAEKAVLCSGADNWTTKPNRKRRIPSLRMADGPHGLRYEKAEGRSPLAAKKNLPATCFPTEAAMAASWNPALTQEIGAAIAEECLAQGVGLLLGPGVNIKRSPRGGRNFEYYSEDPLLSGELAAGFIQGVQNKGVGTSLKHYTVNNQEKYRMSISAAVDERALFDIYLKPFEIAVKKAKPATVMASYNRIGGIYASENRRFLTDILRNRFGFDGAVVTDWGAVNNRPMGVQAGCDLEMPASGGINDWAVLRAVQSGMLTEEALDTACWNMLRLIFRYYVPRSKQIPCNYKAHHQLAADALVNCAVLLKNDDNALPLALKTPLAVIGEMAEKPRFQGAGSSVMNPKNLVGFLDAMQRKNLAYYYAPGYIGTQTNDTLLKQAVSIAQQAEQVLLFLGLPDIFESEGYDREHLRLPDSQLKLLDTIHAVNNNINVVLCCGSPIETPWIDKVKSLLLMHLGGEAVGEAVVRLVYGDAAPSGKLTETWPLQLADTPCAWHFPGGPNEVSYNESIFVGYRYYDTVQKEVRFPFGYGLSYTSYQYSNLKLQSNALQKGEPLRLEFTVANTGNTDGVEIVQAYIARRTSAAFQPAQELKGFCRVPLKAGESKSVVLEIPYSRLSFYDTTTHAPVVEEGDYEVRVGAHSRCLPLKEVFHAAGEKIKPVPAASAQSYYGKITDNEFPKEEFAKLYHKKLNSNRPPRKGEYNGITPLGLMGDSFIGRRLHGLATFVGRKSLSFAADKATNNRIAHEMAGDLPFKNLLIYAGGLVPPRATEALLSLCNGRGGIGRLATAFFAKKPYKKLNQRQW